MVDMEEGERSTSTTDLPLWALEPAGYSRPPTPEKEKAKPKKGLADALKTTALDYGRTSSLHGINYIFESGRDLSSSRLIWVLVVLMASLTGIIWSVEAYNDWQDNPVLTSVSTTAMPIAEIEFPAITICGQGSIAEISENVIEHQFKRYVKSLGRDPGSLTEAEEKELMNRMVRDLYPGLEARFKFILDTMIPITSPDVAAQASVLVKGGFDKCQFENCELTQSSASTSPTTSSATAATATTTNTATAISTPATTSTPADTSTPVTTANTTSGSLTTTTTTISTTLTPSADGYLGCYQDLPPGTLLTHKYDLGQFNSPYACLQYCSRNETMVHHGRTAAEFYYGLRDGSECWCGFYAPGDGLLRDESECNSSCPYYDYYYGESYDGESYYEGSGAGNDSACGGPGRMNVYHYTSSVYVDCGNYSAISCSYCRYDPHTGATYPGVGWCGGDCTWDEGYCVPSGCAYESGIHYDGHDVDYSSYIPDLPSCLSYCKETSRFFTYDEGGNECYCKSSNVNPFVEEGTVSGESGCPPNLPNGTVAQIVPKDFENHTWALDSNDTERALFISDDAEEKESFMVISPGLDGIGTISLKPLSNPSYYVVCRGPWIHIEEFGRYGHLGNFSLRASWIAHRNRSGFVGFESFGSLALDDDTSGRSSVIDFALGDFIKRHVDGRLRKAAADWLTDEASFALIEDSPPARRKRSEPEAASHKTEIYSMHKTDSLDLIFHPEKAEKREQDMETARQLSRDTYRKMDLDKSYPSLFELLWYSQLPCFDVINITTTKAEDEYGMIKRCLWKGQRISCSSMFSMYPTDRGMCCSFNKQKADEMFRKSRYQENIMRLTEQDKKFSSEDSTVPEWFDPAPESGESKGLLLVLDAHSDLVTASTGFKAVVDSRKEYPLTRRNNIMIRPGHTNMVSLGGVKVISNPNIASIAPEKRKCYFDHEHPPHQPLTAHQKYSQVSCLLECRMEHALSMLPAEDRCIPWFLPLVDPECRLCTPFEARNFSRAIENVGKHICNRCLPDCEETQYTYSVSAAPFRGCDFKNLGLTPLCDVGGFGSGGGGGDDDDHTGLAGMRPPMWGTRVIRQYGGQEDAPDYVSEQVLANTRRYARGPQQQNSVVFTATQDVDATYDAYEKDIAVVSFHFERPTAFAYIREARMTTISYISQVGGLMGLCIGFSFLSLIELVYWFTFRMGRNFKNLA